MPGEAAGMAERLGSAVRVVGFYCYSAFQLPLVVLTAVLRPGSAFYPAAAAWARNTLRIFRVRVETRGTEHMQAGRDYVILSNHRSHFDPLAIVVALGGHETRWVAKRELLKVPIFGTTLRVTGQIMVDRNNHEQALRELRANMGKSGASVVFFPEGHRAPTTELIPFKKGGAAFAIDADLPVVPVAISGSERVLRPHTMFVRAGTIRVLFGEPIDVGLLTTDDRAALTDRVRERIEELLATVESRPAAATGEVASG